MEQQHSQQVYLDVALVVIGRNEGERLRRALESVVGTIEKIAYVDSGSSDGSIELAKSYDVDVVHLDMSIPFSAARARNEGVRFLKEKFPDQIQFLQFIDGDCELDSDWVGTAHQFLLDHSDFVVVCGRRRERYPQASLYNYLTDLEWNTPIGEALSCGGDALMRFEAFNAVGGYRGDVIAGEEPELCVRLRERGGKIMRMDAEMTLHDADIHRFSQWWKRVMRGGYAFASGYWIHRDKPEKFRRKENMRALTWGVFLPVLIVGLSFLHPLCLALFLIYPLQAVRIAAKSKHSEKALVFGIFMVLAKFAETVGISKFILDVLTGRKTKILEYKT